MSCIEVRTAFQPILSQVLNLTVSVTIPQMLNLHFTSGGKKKKNSAVITKQDF